MEHSSNSHSDLYYSPVTLLMLNAGMRMNWYSHTDGSYALLAVTGITFAIEKRGANSGLWRVLSLLDTA